MAEGRSWPFSCPRCSMPEFCRFLRNKRSQRNSSETGVGTAQFTAQPFPPSKKTARQFSGPLYPLENSLSALVDPVPVDMYQAYPGWIYIVGDSSFLIAPDNLVLSGKRRRKHYRKRGENHHDSNKREKPARERHATDLALIIAEVREQGRRAGGGPADFQPRFQILPAILRSGSL